MKLINGKKIAQKIKRNLQKKIKKFKRKPGLAVILIGQRADSKLYVSLKEKAAQEVGIKFKKYHWPKNVSQERVIKLIKELNKDREIDGIIVQHPLPSNFDEQKIIQTIDPQKDADGFHLENIRLLERKQPRILPVFPEAILRAIESTRENLVGKQAVILANSRFFGRVLKLVLNEKKITAQYFLLKDCFKNNRWSKNFLRKSQKADIFISAVGQPKLITKEILKKGAIVIDGGITKKKKKVLGDIDKDSVKEKIAYLSPVPGGVGPITVALLLNNVYKLYLKNKRKDNYFQFSSLSPKFIAFEGLDGSGQTTQAKLLKKYLEEQGIKVVLTKEPTDKPPIGNLIRRVLQHKIKVSPGTLQLLFCADRYEHLERIIKPALKKGYWVITDRYLYSTLAYGALNSDLDWLVAINQIFLKPDIVFLLKVRPEVCLKRIDQSRGKREFFEKENILREVWQFYQNLARRFPEIVIVDGEKSIKDVFQDLVFKLREKFGK